MDADFIAINIAYVLYVGATIPKRIIPLRIILILASVAFIVYGIIADIGSVVVWNILFGVPQLYQLIRQLQRQGQADLTAEEQSVYAARFSNMTPRDFLIFWNVGENRVVGDTELITEGQPNNELFLVLEGHGSVTAGGEAVAERGPMSLLGEMSLITGDVASATVRMHAGSHVRVWPHEKIDALARSQPEVGNSILSTLSRELSNKVQRANS